MWRGKTVLVGGFIGVMCGIVIVSSHLAFGETSACTGICHDSYVYGVTTYNTASGVGCGQPEDGPFGAPYCSHPSADNPGNSASCNYTEVLYTNSGCDLYNQEPTAATCSQVTKTYVVYDTWVVRCTVSENACSCTGNPVGQTDTDAPHCSLSTCP